MIRIIVQTDLTPISYFKRLRCLHDALHLNWWNAFKILNKMRKNYGLVIQPIINNETQYIIDEMDILHSKLFKYFHTVWRNSINGPQTIVPNDKYKYLYTFDMLKVYISLTPGFIDSRLSIFP